MEEDKSKIDRLRDILYSRKVKIKPNFVLDLHGHSIDAPSEWQKEQQKTETKTPKEPINISKKIFWLSIGFFVVSLGVSGYVFFNGSNLISPNNIKMEVVGPPNIKAGEETDLDVVVTNNNKTTLELADLIVVYPKGTQSTLDKATPLPRERVALGSIAPGETVRKTVKSILYGELDKPVHLDLSLEYRIPNSLSVFNKDIAYESLIGSAPLTLSVDALKEVNANQDYSLKVTVASNSNEMIRNIVLQGEFPFGFDPKSVSPETITKTTSWALGDIEPHGTRTILIKGKMYGENDDVRFFKFTLGIKDDKIPSVVSGVISYLSSEVVVKQPFLGVALGLEGQDIKTEYTTNFDSTIVPVIRWINNLDVPISDLSIEAKVSGPLIDNTTIKVDKGFYDSNKNILRWNKSYDPKLETITPHDKNSLSFSFGFFDFNTPLVSRITNPEVIVSVTVRGKRRLESGVPEEIISTVEKKIKVNSNVSFVSDISHSTGPFENEGNNPPETGRKTEYTVSWDVLNTFNGLQNAVVVGKLPDYVTWQGIISPTSEKISFNPDSREVTWDVGTITPQQGGFSKERKVYFQIGFTPSISQIGSSPNLFESSTFSAIDAFTGVTIQKSSGILTTLLTSEPGLGSHDSRVIMGQ